MKVQIELYERPPAHSAGLIDSKAVYERVKGYGRASREIFGILYLTGNYDIIKEEIVSVGTIDRAIVYIRDVMRYAVKSGSLSIAAFHNHPSGDPTPSYQDKRLTFDLCAACEIMGIDLLDHIIIGECCYYSFLERGELPGMVRKAETMIQEMKSGY